jgi:mRNA-degrading endonuclease RelE of RelBE toxin-antitoxin system
MIGTIYMWNVKIHRKAAKNINKLPADIQERFKALAIELKVIGPVQPHWPNYGKIRGAKDCHHCHLKKGKPTYVAVWKVTDDNTLEVTYVGTHENADYARLC